MTNKNRKDPHALRRAVTVVDRLIMVGFATGVMIVVALFVYVLSTGGLPKP
jgi:hypothetical protein